MTPTDPSDPTWSVAALLGTVGEIVTHVFPDEVWVEGELRNINRSRAGHVYFDLVDADADIEVNRPSLAVTLFDSDRQNVNRFLLDQGGAVRMTDGTRVRIRGRLGLYPARSRLQLQMSGIDPAFTLGILGLVREQLLGRLRTEDLLDANARITVPALPLHVGLVTSTGTAAHADVVHELESSGFGFAVSVFDCRTQGPEVPTSVTAALRRAERAGVDLVVVVRGGGARTDLAGFDDEKVARAIATLTLPVWTGIGHEIDRSVADDVAHTAHKTPTACAGALVDLVAGARRSLDDHWARIVAATGHGIDTVDGQLDRLGHRCGSAAMRRVDREGLHVHHLGRRLTAAGRRSGSAARGRIDSLAARAGAHDLDAAMRRGWTVTRRIDGTLVRGPDDVVPGDGLVTMTGAGRIRSIVTGDASSATAGNDDGGSNDR